MLNYEDIELLIDALDALEKKLMADAIMNSILGAVALDGIDAAKANLDRLMETAKGKSIPMRDRIVSLKAKLIQMKDKSVADDAASFMKKGPAS